jgi:hydrocephalus-inducing protein
MPNDTPFSKMFHFDVEEKALGVEERAFINLVFNSKILGEFSETFKWKLDGTEDLLAVTFKGHVIAPTFEFDCSLVDFGVVSYKFTERKKIILTNTSEVPFRFNLHIPGDKDIDNKEFEINPSSDVVRNGDSKELTLAFTPKSIQKYDMVLVVNIIDVGEDMLSLPIKAIAEAPNVIIDPA